MTYLVKVKRGMAPVQATEVRVRWKENRRQISTTVARGMGFVHTEHAGWDRTRVMIRPWGEVTSGKGLSAKDRWLAGPVEWTAAGIKTVLRRMRPEEAATLAEIDGRIEHYQERIWQLRAEREQVVTEAWGKAHVVRLNELEPGEGH